MSDADRDAHIAALRAHYADGRITLEEFSERAAVVYAARTRADVEPATRDLPAAPPLRARRRVRLVFGILGGGHRRGRLRIGKRVRAVGFWGAAVLDLREAEFETPEVHVSAVAVMGGVEVIVPEGVSVTVRDTSFLGATDAKIDDVERTPGAPEVHVRAWAFMGGVDVKSKPTVAQKEDKKKRQQPDSSLHRKSGDRKLGGVAAGVSSATGLDVNVVRMLFVLAGLLWGAGLIAYIAGWVLIPEEHEDENVWQRAAKRRGSLSLALASSVATALALVLLAKLGLGSVTSVAWPLGVASGAGVLLWRGGSANDRRELTRLFARVGSGLDARSKTVLALRVLLGAGLAVGASALFLGDGGSTAALRNGALGTLGLAIGAALVFGPWWWGLAGALAEERRERIRTQAEADMAARVHDSVLQTLGLIQRKADDPRTVVGLARRQEHEIREWLYGAPAARDASFRAAVERTAREVEELHGVAVDTVVVGDAPIDDRMAATVAAAREAMVNAAKWSGVRTVSLYAELTQDTVSVFVRDRGVGFDPLAVEDGHHGIAESIHARMQRHRGKAVVRSAPGEGTDVELSVDRGS